MRNHPVKQTPGTKGDATFEDSKEEIRGGVPAREIAKDPVGHLHGLEKRKLRCLQKGETNGEVSGGAHRSKCM